LRLKGEKMNTLLKLAAVGVGGWVLYRAMNGPRYSFRGKHVVLTGGARGLGLLLARRLANEGARLTLCSRTAEELRRAEDELTRKGAEVLIVPCDVTDKAQVAGMVERARTRFGPVDVLINNAGVIGVGPFEEMRLADFEQAMKTHFWGSLYTTLEVVPDMKRRRAGRIVNISSIGGKIAVPHLLPYTASKFALTGLSKGLREELAKDGVVVTTVIPGLMRTGSHLHAEFKGQNAKEYAWFTLGNATPGFSVSGESAAAAIVAACKRGDAELVISLPAKLAVLLDAAFPGLSANLNALVHEWILPAPGGVGSAKVKGAESRGLTPSLLTTLSDNAAARNNETLTTRPANAGA
jgi:NAD(P)-dependent dehydrogenase (short-subunit alcohol dehydrogenase family)